MSETLKNMKEQFELDLRNGNFDNVQSINPSGIDLVESIQIDRQNDYGDAKESHENIAKLWNAYLERKKFSAPFDNIDAVDVAVMMSLMKISRLAYKRKHDSFVDFAAYADFTLQFSGDE
jgi:hypothetical protein